MNNTAMPSLQELPSTAKLLRSTGIALLVALLLLVTAVMPAEYGLDPTGIGRLLGLQAMGEIKRSAQANEKAATTTVAPGATTSGATIAPTPAPTVTSTAPVAPVAPVAAVAPASSAAAAAGVRSDQVSLTLKPGEGAEMKLVMDKGAVVRYRWAAREGAVNFDAHGESSENSFTVSYKKGKDARQDQGTLEAAFKGQHGWYWKNRSRQSVVVDLFTEGQYSAIKRVL